jgi:hypothetical protein
VSEDGVLVVLIHKQQCRSADICVRRGTDYEEANDDRGQKALLSQHNGQEGAKESGFERRVGEQCALRP